MTDKPDLKVVEFTGSTRVPIDCDKVLENLKGQFSYVLVIGWGKDEEGNPLIAASSSSDLREAFYAVDHYKWSVMNMKHNGDDDE